MSKKYSNEVLVIDRKTGRNLYGMRVQMGYSQEAFGKKVGIDQPTMSAYELGKRLPSAKLVRKIADHFGLNPLEITGQMPMNWSSL